ncbi:hypothetical protein DJ524_00375 [Sulfolobus sp. D5]|nr:hypothetical protein DJ524_00375 [Sulfolobus sp. D5]
MLEDYWYPIGFTGLKVKEVNLLCREIIVWRVNDNYVAFQNRCPHRNAKLSMGKILDDRIKCPYHG